MKVAIVGAGKMGRELARRLSDSYDIHLYGRNHTHNELKAAEILIMALPSNDIIEFIKYYTKVKAENQIIVNVATAIKNDQIKREAKTSIRIVAAKIVGHAGQMGYGVNPVVAVSGEDGQDMQVIERLFQKVGNTIAASEEMVENINKEATWQGVRTAMELEKYISQLNLSTANENKLIDAALDNIVVGVIKAYRNNELGGFAKKLIAEKSTESK